MSEVINKMFNIGDISLPKALLFFYVITANQYTGDLLGKQMKTFLNENRIAQHLVAFTMMVAIVHIMGIKKTDELLFYSLILYSWFILTTKLNIQMNLVVIMSLIVWFFYENNNSTDKDENISGEIKQNIKNINKKWNTYIGSGLIMLTLGGVFMYSNKKHIQYGGGYNPINFLLY
jgi:hypothetical protein